MGTTSRPAHSACSRPRGTPPRRRAGATPRRTAAVRRRGPDRGSGRGQVRGQVRGRTRGAGASGWESCASWWRRLTECGAPGFRSRQRHVRRRPSAGAESRHEEAARAKRPRPEQRNAAPAPSIRRKYRQAGGVMFRTQLPVAPLYPSTTTRIAWPKARSMVSCDWGVKSKSSLHASCDRGSQLASSDSLVS